MSSELAPCGTYAAARRHQRHGEELDPRCQVALMDYRKEAVARHRAKKKQQDEEESS